MIRFILILSLAFSANLTAENERITIRVGHFATITHAQAVIGHAFARQGKGWFNKRLGSNVDVDWYVYDAGPGAMEGILIDSIDLTYVGPSPTINAYVKTKGQVLRIICGSCSGGASLVVQSDSSIKTDADFKGKKIATPGFGNTQDIMARTWLQSKGFHITLSGGDLMVVPTQNSDQLLLFKKKELDAVWGIEPWISQLVLETNAKVYLEESSLWPETQGQYVTAHLVSSTKFIKEHSDLLQKWVAAQVELTDWINKNPEEAKRIFREEIKKEIKKDFNPEILDRAWKQLTFTNDPIAASLYKYAADAYKIGFLKQQPDLTNIYDLSFLNTIKEKK